MRITNTIIQNKAIHAMQHNLKGVVEAQTQASTGLKYSTFADDPHTQSEVMRNAGALRAIEQYQKNISDGTSRAALEDSILAQLGDVLSRARQVAIGESSSTATQQTRTAAKAEIDNLLEFVVGLGNTQYGDGYLFGGTFADVPPLSTSAPFYTTSQPPSGNHSTEISAGRIFKTTHNAGEVFLDTSALSALADLSASLGSGDVDGIKGALDDLISSHQSVQALVGDIGARINQLDTVKASFDSLRISLSIYQSDLSEIDQEEAFTKLMARQTTYQAAMLATSRVMGMTLVDYLR